MNGQRTYWHLESARRVPTEYEITSTKLLYYDAARGFEVTTPVQDWYRKYQVASPLSVSDWASFRDPKETTYTSYVDRQKERETFSEGLFRSIEQSHYDRELAPDWLATLEGVLPVLRYPCHALMMVAAYVGQMAPESRIAIAHLFQCADETRRVQHLARRMHQLRAVVPSFGAHSQASWQTAPEWQPLRRVVETLLVTYDFGEALVALDLVVKPMFDRLFTVELSKLAEHHGDPRLAQLLFSLSEDLGWHRELSRELVRVAIEARAENRGVIQGTIEVWRPRMQEALSAVAPLLGERSPHALAVLDRDFWDYFTSLGIEGGKHGSE